MIRIERCCTPSLTCKFHRFDHFSLGFVASANCTQRRRTRTTNVKPHLYGFADWRRRDAWPSAPEAALHCGRWAVSAPDGDLNRQREDRHASGTATVAAFEGDPGSRPHRDLTFIVTRRGTPWTKGALGPNSWRRPAPRAWSGNLLTACPRPRRPRGRKRGDVARVGGHIRLVGGTNGHTLHQKREPRQACRGGRRQVRPC